MAYLPTCTIKIGQMWVNMCKHIIYVPGSKLVVLGMVITPLIEILIIGI